MNWGTELWDQYDIVADHTQKGIDFCERYQHFLKERCSIEFEYANKLKKLVKNYQPRKKDEDEYQYTWANGFQDMIKELHDLAGQHEVIAENTQSSVMKELTVLIAELKADRKKYLLDGSKVQEQLKVSKAQLEKSRRQYEKSFKESEKALEAYRKADADINLSRAEVEKQAKYKQYLEAHRNQMMLKGQQCEKCKNDYASQLQQTNTQQRDHFSALMPQVFQQLQTMDENRINRQQEYFKQCSSIERNVVPIINTCIDGMEKAASSIDAKQDSKLVVDKYKSGFPMPDDIPFDDLSSSPFPESNSNHHNTPVGTTKSNTISGRTSKNKTKRGGIMNLFSGSKTSVTKTDDTKEDFSDLPPNQRRKALQKKIDGFKKDIGRETAEREGMLKMKEVYAKNPALGDPAILDKKIEENAQKLDSLNAELRKFQNYLADAEGKQHISGSDDSISHSTSEGSVQNSNVVSAPGTPQAQHAVYEVYDPHISDDEFDDYPVPPSSIPDEDAMPQSIEQEQVEQIEQEEFEEDAFQVIGTCRAVYKFDADNGSSVSMEENEEMAVIEIDQGDGWTRVRRKDDSEGFVPTSYIQCHFYDQDEV
ncbi:cdc42-interacting protein 4 homolog isoform X3 [Mizuhopecten yessoensis]|uniref:cdc42-interacting protein 4 homolog isoform X3 n=1 Tax=Mizuhopecten yessoensis TaxID=6573 RepID=UPI000B459C4A|nr:cdc42-interacting protein 4 homolog isoform X3 [Mizuhopecten yessoensis]